MAYKTFTWSQNPHTYQEESIREPHYVTLEGVTSFAGMGARKQVITGSGVFVGDTAYEDFNNLNALFEDETPGILVHPMFGNRYCYFTGLEMIQEPRQKGVSYRFTFTCATNNGEIPR